MAKLKVIICKGLPASGKSTWARELMEKEPGKYKRVNKDDLRAMLDNGKWSKSNEAFILNLRDHIILTSLFIHRTNVIVDDTNLHPKHIEHIRKLVGESDKNSEMVVEVKDFTDVPLGVCVERDSHRAKPVGAEVILRMWEEFIKPKIEKIPNVPDAIIVDVDGTLALKGKRSPFDWKSVYDDKPNTPVVDMVTHYTALGYKIIVMSGRDDVCRVDTDRWLRKQGIKPEMLLMRGTFDGQLKDNRKDCIVKKELFETNVAGKYNIEFVLDDRQQVVDMWRSLGLQCFQVNYGYF